MKSAYDGQTLLKRAARSSGSAQAGFLQRKCGCGGHTPMGGQCGRCNSGRANKSGGNSVSAARGTVDDKFHPHRQLTENNTRIPAPAGRIEIAPQSINFEEDPVHRPLIDNYRSATGQPAGGINEFGQRIGPTDAALKYSGILGRVGVAPRWLPPVINRRNAAEAYFDSTPLIDPPGGLTTQFINEREVEDNFDVEAAIPRPAVQTRNERGRTYCWFDRGVSVTGRTTMDIFSAGPWDFQVTGAQADTRFASSNCTGRTGPTVIHVNGSPNDRALEEFIRLGELEHENDSERAFLNTIAEYARNVNNLVGDTVYTRASGADPAGCTANLARLENRNLLTDFVLQLNAATDRRHAGGRHTSGITGLTITRDCSDVTATMDAGTLP